MVEQATENRCVGGSIPPLGTTRNMRSKNFFIFFFIFLLTGCKNDYDYFPHKEGFIWNYKINIGSSYTGSTKQKRLTITNAQTFIQGKGTKYSKIYSNGDVITFFKNKEKNNLYRIAAYFSDNNSLDEPLEKEIIPSLDFSKDSWITKSQLFITKGFQPPLRDFVPSATLEMNYKVISKNIKIKVLAGSFDDCIYIKGTGETEFIADTRSGPNKVFVSSEEWICKGVGIVKENRIEETKSSAFGTQKFYKELISYQN